MVKFLGIADIIASAILVALGFGISLPIGLVIGFAVYLFLKALIFLLDIGSAFDVAAGIVLILSLSMTLSPIVLFVAAGLVGLKGIMSVFA